MAEEIAQWSKARVRDWVFSLGGAFEEYGESLYSDGIHGDDLLEDFDTILEDIQFSKNSHRNKMLREWGKLQKATDYQDSNSQEDVTNYQLLNSDDTSKGQDEGFIPDGGNDKVIIFDELSILEVDPMLREKLNLHPISRDELAYVQKLGSGYFGITFRSLYTPKREGETAMNVALKVAKENHSGDDIREIQIFCQLRKSDNVLPIVGLCQNFEVRELGSRLAIVTPFQAHGDLKRFAENGEWNETQLVNIALGMARGVQQLHAQGVIHRDIAPRNYLIGASGRILITDFGLSRNVDQIVDDEKVYYIHGMHSELPWRSSAPETLEGRKSGKSSDVWMFGVCLWTFVNGRTPFQRFKTATALAVGLERGSKLDHRASCPAVIREVIDACCTHKSSERPTIDEIVSMLLSQELGDWKTQSDAIAKMTRDNQISHQKLQEQARLAQERANGQLGQSLEKIATTQNALKRLQLNVAKLILQDNVDDTSDNAEKIAGLEAMLQNKLTKIEVKVTEFTNEHKKEMDRIEKTFQELEQNMASQDHQSDETQDLFNKLLERLQSDECQPKKGALDLVELQAQYEKNGTTFAQSIPSILFSTCKSGQRDVVQWLLSIEADVNVCYPTTDNSGLMISTLYGHEDIVEFLISKGADVNHENSSGQTALALASIRGYSSLVEFLVSKKADVNHADKMGLTPCKLAETNGFQTIKNFLTEKSTEEESGDPDTNADTPKSAPASIKQSTPTADISDGLEDGENEKEEGTFHGRALTMTVPGEEAIIRVGLPAGQKTLGLGLGKDGYVKAVSANSLAEQYAIQKGWTLTFVNMEKAKFGHRALKQQIQEAIKASDNIILRFRKRTPGKTGTRTRSKSGMECFDNKFDRSKHPVRPQTWHRRTRSRSSGSVNLQASQRGIGNLTKSSRRALSPSRTLGISFSQHEINADDLEEVKKRTAREFQENVGTLKNGISLIRVLKNGQTEKCEFKLVELVFGEYSFTCQDEKESLQCSVLLAECILICGQFYFGEVQKLKKHDSRSLTLYSEKQTINLYAETQYFYDRVVSTLKGLKESKRFKARPASPSASII